eukprot:GHVL01042292.1.p1 GENE.GHVL01042292.1~~GHVL01042292.1.p1  ORF type:complete len:116 (+),score=12.89 GHVL01042292.1:1958-2305(+)
MGVDVGKKKEERLFTGLLDCLKKTYNQDGFFGLYRGFGVSVVGIIVYRAAFFGMYDTAKSVMYDDPKNAPFLMKFGLGLGVETASGIISYPFDTVCTVTWALMLFIINLYNLNPP